MPYYAILQLCSCGVYGVLICPNNGVLDAQNSLLLLNKFTLAANIR
jgi:hypothetical protein